MVFDVDEVRHEVALLVGRGVRAFVEDERLDEWPVRQQIVDGGAARVGDIESDCLEGGSIGRQNVALGQLGIQAVDHDDVVAVGKAGEGIQSGGIGLRGGVDRLVAVNDPIAVGIVVE